MLQVVQVDCTQLSPQLSFLQMGLHCSLVQGAGHG